MIWNDVPAETTRCTRAELRLGNYTFAQNPYARGQIDLQSRTLVSRQTQTIVPIQATALRNDQAA